MKLVVSALKLPEGKRPGWLKGNDGKNYHFWTSGKGAVDVKRGCVYDVETYERDYNGRTEVYLKSAKLISIVGANKPNGAAGTDESGLWIFVTGVVGRAMGSGKFNTDKVTLLANAAYDAYRAVEFRLRKTEGRKAQVQQDAIDFDGIELNDEHNPPEHESGEGAGPQVGEDDDLLNDPLPF